LNTLEAKISDFLAVSSKETGFLLVALSKAWKRSVAIKLGFKINF
jgi:hypothetical protein